MTEMTPKEVDTKIAEIMRRADPHWECYTEKSRTAAKYEKHGGFAKSVARYREEAATALAKAKEIEKEADPFEAEWAKRRWSRFFLCASDGGHIHKRHCSSFRVTTRIGWLPDMSGKTEAEAVEEYGIKMCTLCFPSAPTMASYIKSAAEARKDKETEMAKFCPGSGTTDHDRSRMGYAYFKGGKCKHCGHMVAASSLGKMRKHTSEGKSK